MAKDILISGWQKQWFERTLPTLHCETMLVVYAMAFISLFVGIRGLLRVRRTRKELEANPSNRAAILADCDKRMHKSTKTIFFIANIYLIHSLGLWLTDAAISVSYVYEDVNSNPGDYNASVWLDLAIQTFSMLAIFSAVFIIFPMLQIMGVAHLVKRAVRKNGDGTLAAYIPEGRIVTTHLAQLWMMIGFFVVSWWPVFSMVVPRLVVLEAVFGSGLAWLHASYAFNFRSEALSKIQIEPPQGLGDHVKIYGKEVMAVYNEKSELLPKYEEAANEKSGL